MQKTKFERQPIAMRIEIGINSSRVCIKVLSVLWRRGLKTFFSGGAETENSLLAIMLQGDIADDLRKFSGSRAAHEVHLKEPVLCGDIALREKKVVETCAFDCGDTVIVANDTDRSRDPMDRDRAIEDWKRRARNGIQPGTNCNDSDQKNQQ